MRKIIYLFIILSIYAGGIYAQEIKTDSSRNTEMKNRLIGDWQLDSENGRPTRQSVQLIFRKDSTGTVTETKNDQKENKDFSWSLSENEEKQWILSIEGKEDKKKEGGPIKFENDCLVIDDSCFKKVSSVSVLDKENKQADIINKMVGEWYMESDNGRPVKESLQFVFRKDGTGSAVMKAKGKEEKKDFSWTVSEESAGQWRFSAVEKERGRKEGGSVRFEGDCLMIDKSCLKKVNSNAISDNDKRKEEMMSKIVGDWVMETENGKSVEVSIQFSFRKDGTGTGTASVEGKVEQKEFNWSVSEKSLNEWVMSVTEKENGTKEEGPIRFEGDCLMVENSCFKKVDPSSAAETEKRKDEIIKKITGDWELETEKGKPAPYGETVKVSFFKDGKGKTVTETADRKTKNEDFIWSISLKNKDQWLISFQEKHRRRSRIETKEISFKENRLFIGELGLKKRNGSDSNSNPVNSAEVINGIIFHLKTRWSRQRE